MTNPCEKSFNKGIEDRQKYPLHTGSYKLNETTREINRQIKAIDRIIAWKQKWQDGSFFICCTSADCDIWLKSLPIHISKRMGYNIQPAITALVGNGISKQDITVLEKCFRPKIEEFVEYCDEVRERYRKNISLEYHNMIYGQSEFRELNLKALFIITGILASIP